MASPSRSVASPRRAAAPAYDPFIDFGVSYFPTDEAIEPAELGILAEERGLESIFVTDHTHLPAVSGSSMGGAMARKLARTYDPFVALAAIAASTERIRVGTAICLLVERDPIITAKQVASIDRLSGGRMLFGVGAGWNVEEMRNHGTDPERRFGILRERVEACKAIWTEDEASYHGRHVVFDRIWCWPKPVQDPHPPVMLGGNGATVLDRVLAYADAWLPNLVGPDNAMIDRIAELQGRARTAARGAIPVTVVEDEPRDPEVLERYERAGVTRAVHELPAEDAASRGAAERKLDQLAARMHSCS